MYGKSRTLIQRAHFSLGAKFAFDLISPAMEE